MTTPNAPSSGTASGSTGAPTSSTAAFDDRALLHDLIDGNTLDRPAAAAFMEAVLAQQVATERLIAVLAILRARRERTDEVLGFLDALMARAVRLPVTMPVLVDTCGTGGDNLGSFNLSTATAVVVACNGVAVAKHGNRSVSSQCGSTDVLEAAGVPITNDIDFLSRTLQDLNIAFLHAPFHHPALAVVGPVRRALGVMTVFNLLGPLANPARLTHQVVGVPRLEFVDRYVEICAVRGVPTLVLHGHHGADEALPGGPFHAATVEASGTVDRRWIDPADLGVAPHPVEAFRGGDAATNAGLLRDLLDGVGPVALRDAIALNAGLVLHHTAACSTPEEGIARARRTLASGEAGRLLRAYIARRPA